MKAVIITIGDEILIGQIVDTNSSYIALALNKIGVEVVEMRSVSDDESEILKSLAFFQDEVDFVFITGGLGPTKDDLTKHTLCNYFNDTLVVDENVLHHVVNLIEKVMKRPASQINRDQALVLSKATVLFNQFGTAPGTWIQKGKTVFISLPGVPYEMKHLIDDVVIPKISNDYKRPFIIHKTIMTYGQGESQIAERIEEWENQLPSEIKLAYLPSPGKVRLRLSARGNDEDYLNKLLQNRTDELYEIIGDIIVGFDENQSIQVVLNGLLTEKKMTISVAESCTGGMIAQMLTSTPGASNYFKGGLVAYATESKLNLLKVKLQTINSNSVVSEAVAIEMALGCQKIFDTDFAIATTGNAGPNKGDSSENLGVVFIAIATPNGTISQKFEFGQPREKVILRASNKALEWMHQEILKNY